MRIILMMLICLLYVSCESNPQGGSLRKNKTYGVMKFDDLSYDFGEIKNGDTVYHTFKLTNIGNAPLIIYDISTSCGCTVADWTKEPILSKQIGHVTVQFTKMHDPGIHRKNIIVKANTEDPYTVLKISANISKEKQTH